ncbi:MAG: hypothetical protein M3128_00890 [Verrucomicrobiota bacterium]|nr:hypothetical protein [Verrucomicrobiota bacterium]
MNTVPDFAMCVPDCFKDSVKHYSFGAGDTLYDVVEAYGVWSEALRQVAFCLQVKSATPGRGGKITFSIFTPNKTRTALMEVSTVESTQERFVHLLRTGDLNDFLSSAGARKSLQ